MTGRQRELTVFMYNLQTKSCANVEERSKKKRFHIEEETVQIRIPSVRLKMSDTNTEVADAVEGPCSNSDPKCRQGSGACSSPNSQLCQGDDVPKANSAKDVQIGSKICMIQKGDCESREVENLGASCRQEVDDDKCDPILSEPSQAVTLVIDFSKHSSASNVTLNSEEQNDAAEEKSDEGISYSAAAVVEVDMRKACCEAQNKDFIQECQPVKDDCIEVQDFTKTIQDSQVMENEDCQLNENKGKIKQDSDAKGREEESFPSSMKSEGKADCPTANESKRSSQSSPSAETESISFPQIEKQGSDTVKKELKDPGKKERRRREKKEKNKKNVAVISLRSFHQKKKEEQDPKCQGEERELKVEAKKEERGISSEKPDVVPQKYGKDFMARHGIDVVEVTAKEKEANFNVSDHVYYALKEEMIHFNRNGRDPNKWFYNCNVCPEQMKSLVICQRHISLHKHRTKLEVYHLKNTIKMLPCPRKNHIEALDRLLHSVEAQFGMHEHHLKERHQVAEEFSSLIETHMKGLGLVTSNLNLEIEAKEKSEASKRLEDLLEIVKQHNDMYREVEHDFKGTPYVSFKHCKSGITCVVNIRNGASLETSKLLREYASLDPRVKTLTVALRRWAKLCNIDQQSTGTLPPHAYTIMVVHYLQRTQPPCLPCLHELASSENPNIYACASDLPTRQWVCHNKESVGALWLSMIKYLAVTLPQSNEIITIRTMQRVSYRDKGWSQNRIPIEDPFSPKQNLGRYITGNQVNEFIMRRFQFAFHYFGIPHDMDGPLFRFITKDRALAERMAIRARKAAAKEEENHEEPDDKSGLAINSTLVADGVPGKETVLGSVDLVQPKNVQEERGITSAAKDNSSNIPIDEPTVIKSTCCSPGNDSSSELIEAGISGETERLSSPETSESISGPMKSSEEMSKSDTEAQEKKKKSLPKLGISETSPRYLVLFEDALHAIMLAEDIEFNFTFSGRVLSRGEVPMVVCKFCLEEGHSKKVCPSRVLPPIVPLPSMQPQWRKMLDQLCERQIDKWSPTQEDINSREVILRRLEKYIQGWWPKARLKLFGSSCNGFGFQHSDLDICLTFTDDPTGEHVALESTIEVLADMLKRNPEFKDVIGITQAKVPIVKFVHILSNLEGDISLYNTLAQRNTLLLLTYASLDKRVKALGYTIKVFAKTCSMGDASRGSLSSYAYIIMLLHFLQQRDPPVIPVLQELEDAKNLKTKVMVDGWDTYFFEDTHQLGDVWDGFKMNVESTGMLWVGLLDYYARVFDFDEHVITIRQKKPLTRFEKLWTGSAIAIEDPFDLSHNLGNGVSFKMALYIRKAFIRAREVFGTPQDKLPDSVKYPEDYFFMRGSLTDEQPPNDRGCRYCGCIGHVIRDCPHRLAELRRKKEWDRQFYREPQQQTQRYDATAASAFKVGAPLLRYEARNASIVTSHKGKPIDNRDGKKLSKKGGEKRLEPNQSTIPEKKDERHGKKAYGTPESTGGESKPRSDVFWNSSFPPQFQGSPMPLVQGLPMMQGQCALGSPMFPLLSPSNPSVNQYVPFYNQHVPRFPFPQLESYVQPFPFSMPVAMPPSIPNPLPSVSDSMASIDSAIIDVKVQQQPTPGRSVLPNPFQGHMTHNVQNTLGFLYGPIPKPPFDLSTAQSKPA